MGTQKTPIQKSYIINIGQDTLDIDFQGQIGSSTRLNYLLSMKKARNTCQYMTATMSRWPQK